MARATSHHRSSVSVSVAWRSYLTISLAPPYILCLREFYVEDLLRAQPIGTLQPSGATEQRSREHRARGCFSCSRGGLCGCRVCTRRMFVTATRRSCRTACATSAALSEAKGCWCCCADVDFISHSGSASHIIAAVCCSRRARACCHHRSSAPAFTAATATEWHSFWQQRAAFAADVAAREMQRELGRSHQ